MEYEIVNLEEKIIVGTDARTNNFDPKIGEIIGNLWKDFFEKGIYQNIQDKSNHKSLGIYTDYEGNEKNDYTVITACEVTKADNIPQETIVRTIPAGKYAKFILKGNMYKIVMEFWEKLWKMNLERAFTYDFEEYQNDDMENTEVHVYIALK